MWSRLIAISTVTISSTLLTACVNHYMPPPVMNSVSPVLVTKSSSTLSKWSISGAVAAHNHHKSWSAALLWQQSGPHHYTIRLYGPLNGSAVLIEKRGQETTYETNEKIVRTPDIETLIAKETGIKLPLNQLYYWVRGLHTPNSQHRNRYDTQGHLIELQQGKYTLRYSEYIVTNQLSLPTKIQIIHPDGVVKLVIKRWVI